MKPTVKFASGEIVFYDRTTKKFNSLEQLLRIIVEEYENKRLGEVVRIEGIDEEGKVYKLGFDFGSFQTIQNSIENTLLDHLKSQKFLGQVLVESGVITSEQLEKALEEQGKQGFKEKIGETLIRLKFCTAEQILYALAKQLGIFIKNNSKGDKNGIK
ncbi:MAG: hypothetical protein ACK4JE_02670 [Endomicrobiia bacterium]